MEKVIHCRDIGFDCDGVIKAENEEEAAKMAAEHAREVHGIEKITPEVADRIKSAIHEEP